MLYKTIFEYLSCFCLVVMVCVVPSQSACFLPTSSFGYLTSTFSTGRHLGFLLHLMAATCLPSLSLTPPAKPGNFILCHPLLSTLFQGSGSPPLLSSTQPHNRINANSLSFSLNEFLSYPPAPRAAYFLGVSCDVIGQNSFYLIDLVTEPRQANLGFYISVCLYFLQLSK